MRKIKNILSLSMAAALLLIGCSETLEDTYGDVTDGGKIRYVAKCSDLSASAGWERLIVEWKNGTDATIDKIKLIWTYNGLRDSVLLDPLTSKYELKNLINAVYRFDITALDKDGNKSLSETTYGRPYTREHEVMNAFTRGVIKSYYVNDKMVFFADKWNPNISEIKLVYKNNSGVQKEYLFDKDATYGKLITINDVSTNPEDKVIVLRKGRFEGSLDEIEFDPMPISRLKNYSSGFINYIESKFGLKNNTGEEKVEFDKFIDKVEVLEFDYDIESFEDILHCPKLKKIVFGKNRFISSNFEVKYRSLITGEEAKSRILVEKAIELLKIKIEYYGLNAALTPHYFNPKISISEYKGMPQFPSELNVVGKEEYRAFENGELITCTPTDQYAELDNLLDNDYVTRWETTSTQRLKNYEMLMELKADTEVSGIKISQPIYDTFQDKRTPFFMPKFITIQTSVDGSIWEDVTFFKNNILGRSSGETTHLKIHEGKRTVRYIKVFLQDGVDNGGNFMISLGDIVLLK